MIELNKTHHMNCLMGLKQIPNKSIDICVTSPPYNIGVDYGCGYDDDVSLMEYVDFIENVSLEIRRVLKDNGSYFLNMGFALRNQIVPFKVIDRLYEYFVLQNTIVWVKSLSVGDSSYGHFKPVNSDRYHYNGHEYIFHMTKMGDVKLDKLAVGVPYKDKSNITRWKGANNQDLRDRGNVWFIPYKTVNGAKSHPAAFPVELPKMCIQDHGYDENTVVLDPFMGIGTTAHAAKMLGCKYIGFELNGEYICNGGV